MKKIFWFPALAVASLLAAGGALAHDDAHLDTVVAASPQLYCPWLEATLPDLHQNHLAGAAVDDCRGWRGDHLTLGRHRQFDLRKHAGLELHCWVGQLDPDRHTAGFRLERRIDVGDFPLESLVRIGIDLDSGVGAGLHHTDVLLENVGDHPDSRQVGHLVEHLTGQEGRGNF